MAPTAKRKRNAGDPGENRPSPHRPQSSLLGQHDRGAEMRDGGRRPIRGGQGGMGRGGRRGDGRENPNRLNIAGNGRATPTPGPMSPPPPRPASSAQTPIQTPTPAAEIPSPTPKKDPAPFDYTFLTDERIASWDATGRQEVVAAGIQACQDQDAIDLASIFQELIRAALDGRMDSTAAGLCVKEIIRPDTSAEEESEDFDPQTTFLDMFSMLYDAEEGPMNPDLRSFAVATGVSPQLMRLKLDGPFLQDLGLTRDTFLRVGVRQATNLLYRQANYNLLREETEGYSKLVTELFTTSGSEPPSSEVVEDTFERVKGLIGTFDLDVGRVLDITLDVFAAVLIKHFRFFIKLLRVSSWWPRSVEIDGIPVSKCGGLPTWALPTSPGWMPEKEEEELLKVQRLRRDKNFWDRAREVGLDAFFELGDRQLLDAETKKRVVGDKRDPDAELDAERQWIETTGTFPPSGNRVAAQLLGFKLRFYTSTARDKEDVLPSNLIYLAALLIKVGFISLRDLYAHLWPLDEDMPAVRLAREKELAEKERSSRGGGAANALTMAGALPDDTLPNNGRVRESAIKPDPVAKVAPDVEDKLKLNEPIDQKVQLLQCLLTIGAIPESLFILGRFPWLPDAYPELVDLINRILNYSIKDVYELSRPSTPAPYAECPTIKFADLDQTNIPKGQVRLTQLPTKKLLRWPFPDKSDTNDNLSYRFYWDEWADNVPVCQNVDDLFTLCGTLLNLAGVSVGKDASLLSKLAKIGAYSLTTDTSQQNLDRWGDLLKRLLVPALSLTKSNTSVVNEIYDMLRFYPVSVRYSIYAEWFEGATCRIPAMKVAFARAKYETERTMKRISLTNLTAMARTLAKTAYWAPGIVFKIALSQIEAYSNLTEVVVECAKYFTDLGYDVLIWSLLSSLGGKDRNRNNAEFALLPSRWLLALSRFSGKVFRRYSIMNLSPILQYVNDQLYHGNSTDLVILKELIAQMSGIVPDTDYNDAQLAAMTGGEALRKQTLINLQDKRYESTKTSKRLMRGLTETRLGGELLIGIAQHRQAAIYAIAEEDAHIKLLATMIDDTQLILFQYLDLLRSSLSPEEFDRQVPSIPELMEDFGLHPALAFLIGRASLAYRRSKIKPLNQNGAPKSLQASTEAEVDADGDVGMEGKDPVIQINGDNGTPQPIASMDNSTPQEDATMIDAKEESISQAAPLERTPSPSVDPFHEIMEPIILTVQKVLPEGSFKHLSPEFYAFFWTCALGDLTVPSASYQTEINRLNAKEMEKLPNDRGDSSRAVAAARKEKEEAKRADIATRDAILSEFRKAVTGFGQKKARLLKNKGLWFDKSVKADDMSVALLEKCLIPRLLLSPSDADYSFRMIKFLHDNGVPQFRTLSLYGHIFRANRLRSIIFTCTVREAENLGRFLRLALSDLARWHGEKSVYEKEAWGKNLPGFAKALDEDGKPKAFVAHDGNKGFKSILYHWHKNLNTALRDCLDGTEWMHIRNAITILKSVVEVFPAVDFMGNNFIKQLNSITEREKQSGGREDLSLTGNGVLVQLKKRSKKWVIVQEFGHILVDAKHTNGNTSEGKLSNANAKSILKPTAPEFKPQSRDSSLGISTTRTTAIEVEDGEVDDAKMATPTTSGPQKPPVVRSGTPETKVASPAGVATMESKKSEILDRREQIKRENAAKAAALPPPAHQRQDPSRGSILDRGSPSLPNRPDAPFPPRDLIDRHQPRHTDRRDARDSRLPDLRGLDRAGPRPVDRGRDFPGGDRRGPDQPLRDFGRPNDRNPANDRDRTRPDPPPRWTGESNWESLDRLNNGPRGADSGRLSRDVLPVRASGGLLDRGAQVNPERMALVNPERQELINPERAALISGEKDMTRSESPRRARDDIRDRTLPRPLSPRRVEKDYPESRRDDRRNGPPPEVYNSSRGRAEDVQPPPVGPRGDRPMGREQNMGTDRSSFLQSPPGSRSMDPDHGRLNPGPRPQPDPNFGRLNPVSTPEIPSGPRDRNSRGGRPANPIAPPRRDIKPDMPRPPTPEKQPPTGPSGVRYPRRSASGQFDQNPTISGNTGITSPAPAIHPDRLAQLGSSVPQTPQQLPPVAQVSTPTIHPERMKAFGNEAPPPPPQMNNGRSRQPLPPLATGGPPSGPKGAQSSPMAQSVNGFMAPTGPASTSDRANRGGRRQLAGINTMLQQAGQQMSTPDRLHTRGRGRLSSGIGPETPISGPPTPIVPPPPPGLPPGRHHEPPRDGGRELVNPDRPDLITGGAPPIDDRERDRNGRRGERSGRHSRRTSRSPGRERESKHGPVDERVQRTDYRDRSDRHAGDSDRERHSAQVAPKDLMVARETGSRGDGRDREHRVRESSRRDGREREIMRDASEPSWGGERSAERVDRSGGGERGGRSREMREVGGEDRRDSRGNREDGGSGRKRRTDGDTSEPRSHQEKRPRRA